MKVFVLETRLAVSAGFEWWPDAEASSTRAGGGLNRSESMKRFENECSAWEPHEAHVRLHHGDVPESMTTPAKVTEYLNQDPIADGFAHFDHLAEWGEWRQTKEE